MSSKISFPGTSIKKHLDWNFFSEPARGTNSKPTHELTLRKLLLRTFSECQAFLSTSRILFVIGVPPRTLLRDRPLRFNAVKPHNFFSSIYYNFLWLLLTRYWSKKIEKNISIMIEKLNNSLLFHTKTHRNHYTSHPVWTRYGINFNFQAIHQH